jgi:redox-sensitive bicupin YhaK (pirin superfamily)
MSNIVHLSTDRGYADHGWLKARHSFSFAGYNRSDRMNFGMIRVLNDDEVAPGMGFGTHPHDNMEIVTIPLEGIIAHRDSMGHEETLSPGEVQAMSAGTGITHSEYNGSKTDVLRLLQLWVIPRERGVIPQYEQKAFRLEPDRFTTLVSPDGRDGSLRISQEAIFSRASLSAGVHLPYEIQIPGNGVYFFVIDGKVTIDGERLGRRDALGLWDSDGTDLSCQEDADVLCIEVPMQF